MVIWCDAFFQFHHVAAWELVWAASYRGLWREALKQVGIPLISGYDDMGILGYKHEHIRIYEYKYEYIRI